MARITRIDRDEEFRDGKVVASAERVVDITADVNELDIHVKLRDFVDRNRTFLALPAPTAAQQAAQVARLTRQVNHLIRLNLRDLLDDETVD